MGNLIQNFIFWVDSSKYVLLFMAAIPEGPVMMATSGFLYHLGQFEFWPMYFVLVTADFIADISWYCIGRFGTATAIYKYGHFLNINPASVGKVEKLFNKYHQKILIISKLTIGFGFGFIVLMVAGMSKVNFKRYVVINLFGGLIWTFFLIGIGYFFGNVFTLISVPMKIVFLSTVVLVVVLAVRFFSGRLKEPEERV